MEIELKIDVPERSKEEVLRAIKLIELGARRDSVFLRGFVNYMEASLQVESDAVEQEKNQG